MLLLLLLPDFSKSTTDDSLCCLYKVQCNHEVSCLSFRPNKHCVNKRRRRRSKKAVNIMKLFCVTGTKNFLNIIKLLGESILIASGSYFYPHAKRLVSTAKKRRICDNHMRKRGEPIKDSAKGCILRF